MASGLVVGRTPSRSDWTKRGSSRGHWPRRQPRQLPRYPHPVQLAPLATACRTLLPGAIDNAEVLAGPDNFIAARPAAADAVWLTGRQKWTGEQLFGLVPLSQPVLLSPDRIRFGGGELVATTLTSCLLGGGSLVLVESADDLTTIAAQEDATEV